MSNAIKLGFGYQNTDFKRDYTISGVADSVVASDEGKDAIRDKVKAINASLAGGTDDGLASTFLSDDYDATASIGAFNHIHSVTIYEKQETELDISGGEG